MTLYLNLVRLAILAGVLGGTALAQAPEFDREAFRERLYSNWAREQALAMRQSRHTGAGAREDSPYHFLALRLQQNYDRTVYNLLTPTGGLEYSASQTLERRRRQDAQMAEYDEHEGRHPEPTGYYGWSGIR